MKRRLTRYALPYEERALKETLDALRILEGLTKCPWCNGTAVSHPLALDCESGTRHFAARCHWCVDEPVPGWYGPDRAEYFRAVADARQRRWGPRR